ncbi:NAC domain-containing protein [Actinidia chinensis var. chinensis]|uniref:NAC domain-containing protein n=1 Tax=Actinidia chinensis var. chinensis TaxID=1590841 RepID=A0A2R6P8W7_ACTCC|nr:NAC domain-containing protein [Actinidia chinensis var. chinensis]
MDGFDKTKFGCELADRPMFVTIGGLKFPIGYRFCPTSEQLLKYYLKPKVDSRPLHAQVIVEFDAFQTNPWDLPGDGKEKRFFFCKRKLGNGRRWNGMSESGCWKAKGKEVRVLDNESDQVIGVKRSLIFCEKKYHGDVLEHQWVMKEYRLVDSQTGMQLEDWVVCKVYQKPHKTKYRRIRIQASDSSEESSVVDPMEGDRHSRDESSHDVPQISSPSSSSSSSSSWISEISSIESDQEETSPTFFHFVLS